jgi:membrane-associated phospholipid phosphatase
MGSTVTCRRARLPPPVCPVETWPKASLGNLRVAGSARRRRTATVLALAVATIVAPLPAFAESALERAGDVGAVLLPVAGLALAGAKKDGKGVLQLAEAYGSTMALVYILKPTVNRTRPNGGHDSFPSGHAASAFAGAAFLQIRYGWAYGAPAYALATYVAWSRVHAKQHYTSDVLAGGAIAIAGSLVFTRRYGKVSIQPVLGPRTVGLAIEASW